MRITDIEKLMAEPTNIQIKAAGEHYVCAELSRLGVSVALTSNNTAAVDILATTTGKQTVSIQVKASRGTGNSHAWDFGRKPTEISDSLFFVFVNVWLDSKRQPEYFVVPSAKVHGAVDLHKSRPLFTMTEQEADLFRDNWIVITKRLS